MNMKINIIYLLLTVLLGIVVFTSIAQQNQNVPKTDTEIEKLKKRVTELEGKLQIVENVEKIELAAKLAEAQAKLNNTDIDKLKGELRESNNDWLRAWSSWFIGIVTFIVLISGAALLLVLKTLIEKGIEKRLNGFKDAVEQVKELQDQMRYLLKENAVAVLGHFSADILVELDQHTKLVKALSNEVLMDVFNDKTHDLDYKWLAAEALVAREYTDIVAPLLNFLKDIVKSNDFDRIYIFSYDPRYHIRSLLFLIGKIHTQETYKCLISFINFLQKENPKNKGSWIAWTTHSFASVSVALNKRDSTVIPIESIPDWDFSTGVPTHEHEALTEMINYFNLLNAPKEIKAILTNGLTDGMPEVEKRCLQLLREYDSEFVRDWEEKKADTNTESEETDESEPTE